MKYSNLCRQATGILLLASVPFAAGFKYPGCADVTDADFRYVKIFSRGAGDPTLNEPVDMSLSAQEDGSVDIYFVERHGKIKYYNGAAKTVTVIGELVEGKDLDSKSPRDNGLISIALDPKFRTNHQLYLFYTPLTPAVLRLSQFTLKGNMIDRASEKVLLSIPMQREMCCHTGSGMVFDAYGDLWINVGNNGHDAPEVINEDNWAGGNEASASNPGDLRGGVLRIHPDNSERGYSIPSGNFGEYWAGKFAAQGKADLAKQYADQKSVLPEIYVKGTRSNYSINVDPYRRWMAWGEFGPPGIDEHNLVTHPVFGGWPYFAGPGNRAYYPANLGTKDPLVPMNNSRWNKGPKQLPPAEMSIHPYSNSGGGGATGPIYRYDGDSPSKIKFPPHFDKVWLVGDFSWTGMKAYLPNESGDKLIDSMTLFKGLNLDRALKFQQGPDGALYVLNYAGRYDYTLYTGFIRIEYTGTCRPAEPKLPTVSVWDGAKGRSQGFNPIIRRGLRNVWVSGAEAVSIHDTRGVRIFAADIPADRGLELVRGRELPDRSGIYLLTARRGNQSAVFKLVW